MLITIMAFLFILGFSVTIHEIGHFIAAKLSKIPVEKFSIGYGPPLIRMNIGETDFRIAVFPLGGYVKMVGDFEGEILKPKKVEVLTVDKREGNNLDNTDNIVLETTGISDFYGAKTHKRVLVVAAGPLANIFSAFIVLIIIFSFFGAFVTPFLKLKVENGSWAAKYGLMNGDSVIALNNKPMKVWEDLGTHIYTRDSNIIVVVRNGQELTLYLPPADTDIGISPIVPPVLGTVKRNGAAYGAGMKRGDTILKINDLSINEWEQMVDIIRSSPGTALNFTWSRNGNEFQTEIVPRDDPASKDTVGEIGVMMALAKQKIPLPQAIISAGQRTIEYLWIITRTLYQLIAGKVSRRNLGGPIAIFRLSGESASWGFEYLLSLLALISVNLGLINLFPLPAFDGGHALIAIIEGIRRGKFSRKTHLIIQQIGYAMILILIILVFYNDLTR
ncbi:RIP metalloprotease RseP [candidate division WOR-3 bacterium RBG_13_43_14]|uniref:Zinc metalloprotease n=1 Tax=candidate division WOR-3 bacterium RBG_13_43_14 TaxID=1802590 RepID=A0A1F4UAI3_UNCW3|nr:MAG: RIP metalloprotease RseP [candidate division WOR-3 bacterium RBG_13_43_14]